MDMFPASTKFGDICMQAVSSYSCIHLCENMTGVGVTSYREEIVVGQVVYLSEHRIVALN